ncbi:hypothetical protein AB0H42_24640 [Nocardia sp. NPDC050799]|uniref:ABC transporter substrate-binding protein n=1 Tax=Nocardia sp. NPDC050799 TaxID=3154842 RepID=UPI00340E3D13
MKKRALRRVLTGATSAVLVCGVLAGCATPTGSTASDSTPADAMCPTPDTAGKITMSMSSPLAVFAPLLLALETDAFAGTGLEVTTEPLKSAEAIPLVARGELDAQISSLSAAHFNTVNSGVAIKWIAPMDLQQEIPQGQPVAGYWARADLVGSATDPNLAALRGARVSTPTGGGGISGLILDNALSTVGLGIEDVNLTAPLVGPDALTGLINGSVDLAWVSAPLEVQAAQHPELVPVAGYEPGVTGTSILAGPGLLDRPEVTVKFLQVLRKVTEQYLSGDYRKDPETVALLAAAQETDENTIRNAAPLTFDPEFGMDGAAQFAETFQQFSMTRGELEYAEPLDITRLVDTRFAEALQICADTVG